MGISVKGFGSEVWPTFGVPTATGPFVEAFRKLGIESKLDICPGSFALMYRRKGGKLTTSVSAPGIEVEDPTAHMFDAWQLDAKEREVSLGILAEIAMFTPEQLDALENVSVQQWLAEKEHVPRPLHTFLATQCNLMATGLYELVSISAIARVMQVFFGGRSGYPRGGYGRLIDDVTRPGTP